jgi:hypothetical protein
MLRCVPSRIASAARGLETLARRFVLALLLALLESGRPGRWSGGTTELPKGSQPSHWASKCRKHESGIKIPGERQIFESPQTGSRVAHTLLCLFPGRSFKGVAARLVRYQVAVCLGGAGGLRGTNRAVRLSLGRQRSSFALSRFFSILDPRPSLITGPRPSTKWDPPPCSYLHGWKAGQD